MYAHCHLLFSVCVRGWRNKKKSFKVRKKDFLVWLLYQGSALISRSNLLLAPMKESS